MKTLSFPIKKSYLAEKVSEQQATGIFYERRANTKFWRTRIGSTNAWRVGGKAVFLCGRDSFRATIRAITFERTPEAIHDVVATDVCYRIECQFESLGWVSAWLTTDRGDTI
jgi:hypothetical protein